MSMNGSLDLGVRLRANTSGFVPQIRDASRALQQLQGQTHTTGNAMGGAFQDAAGRMRGANGRFLSSGQQSGRSWASGFRGGIGSILGGGGGGGLGALFGAIPGVGGLLSGGGLVAGFGSVIGAANDFTVALHQVKAISGATVPQMKQLENAALEAGMATQFDPTQAANALGDLASAGYNVQDSMTLLVPTLDLAAASLGQLSPSDAAGLASQALKAFRLNADQAGPTVDKLVQSMNLFAVQAKDLPLGIAGVSRGAGAMNQSLDESLIAFGLVRNIMPRVESASMAVSTAMERMVDSKVQQKLHGIGVSVQDSAGKFRPFLDVVGDMLPELEKMTDARRAAFLQDTFGAEALGGFNAIMGQVTKGIQTSSGETLKGAAAIKYLRDQFAHADGTAAAFRDEMLKDLPGQLTLLSGSLKTLAVQVGKPMADVLAPITKGVLANVNGIIDTFKKLPDSTKSSLAKVALLVGLIGTAFLLAGGPVALLVGAVIAGSFAIKSAIDNNVGGLGDKFHAAVKKVRLVWDGFVQLFTQGGFSGAVRKELNSAENSGIKNFVIGAWVWLNRLKAFFGGISSGFMAGLEAMRPALGELSNAFSGLARSLGLTSDVDPAKNKSKWETFARVGAKVGTVVAAALNELVEEGTRAISFVTGFIDGLGGWEAISSDVSHSLRDVGDVIRVVASSLGMGSSSAFSAADAFRAVGFAISTGISSEVKRAGEIIRTVTGILSGLTHAFHGIGKMFKSVVAGDWVGAWQGFREFFLGIVKSIVVGLGQMVLKLASAADVAASVVGKKLGAEKNARKLLGSLTDRIDKEIERKVTFTVPKPIEDATSAVVATRNATLAEVGRNSLMALPGGPLIANRLTNGADADARKSALKVMSGPTHVTVVLDGEQIAAKMTQRQVESAQRSGGDIAVPNE